jgi:N-acetylmuramoyl-L-alanine amidase
MYYVFLVGCPNILNRSSWNARPYIGRENITTLPVTYIVIRQLEDSKSTMNQHDCIKTMKDLQDFQIDKRGWADIGYNFLICNDNDNQQRIYRGRGWTHVGAHCIGYNYRSLGKNQFCF